MDLFDISDGKGIIECAFWTERNVSKSGKSSVHEHYGPQVIGQHPGRYAPNISVGGVIVPGPSRSTEEQRH
jgi:hypothetical protein